MGVGFHVLFRILLLVIYVKDGLVGFFLSLLVKMSSVRRVFLFLLVLTIGCVILLRHSLCLPYDYFSKQIFYNYAMIAF